MLLADASTSKLQGHIRSWTHENSFRKLVGCFAQCYRLGLQVRKLRGSFLPHPDRSKNTNPLATTERGTASTTGSSQVYSLNHSLILHLHTCCLHSFKCHPLHTTACLPGQPVNRGARKSNFSDCTTTFRGHLHLLETQKRDFLTRHSTKMSQDGSCIIRKDCEVPPMPVQGVTQRQIHVSVRSRCQHPQSQAALPALCPHLHSAQWGSQHESTKWVDLVILP